MIEFLIIAHAPLASALKAVAEHLHPGAAPHIHAVDVAPSQSPNETLQAANLALKNVAGADVLVLTDVFGATPCNAATGLCARPGTRVIAGINVPALWRAVAHADESLDQVADLAVAGVQQSVMHVGPMGVERKP